MKRHPTEIKALDACFARASGKPRYGPICLTLADVTAVRELLPPVSDPVP